MKAEERNYPLWLVDNNLTYVIKILTSDQLYKVTALSIKENSLLNCFIVDHTYEIEIIEEVIDLGNANSIWMFEFFNPLRKVQYKTVSINSDNQIYNKILNLVKKNPKGSELL